jgi:carbon-monoxide dehydrogenase medium subunit
MIPAPVGYLRPQTMDEAFAALADGDAKILAGGHSLIPLMKLRLARPSVLVDVSLVVPAGIRVSAGDGAWIGAGTTWRELAAAPELGGCYAALRAGAAATGDIQVRNRGTIGGGLCHADPAADITAAALALDAALVIAGPGGPRTAKFDGFVASPFEPGLGAQDVLTAVLLPPPPAGAASAYQSVEYAASGYPIAGAAALVEVAGSQVVTCRLGITGVAGRAFRPLAAEASVLGWGPASGWADLRSRVRPVGDGVAVMPGRAGGPAYVTAMAELVTARAIRQAFTAAAAAQAPA